MNENEKTSIINMFKPFEERGIPTARVWSSHGFEHPQGLNNINNIKVQNRRTKNFRGRKKIITKCIVS
jgi:hypothetical protein